MNDKMRLGLGAIILVGMIAAASLGYNELKDNYRKDKSSMDKGTETALAADSKEETKTLAPDFTVYNETGKLVKLSDYKGTPVVLNFWASWCPPCREEMPYFNEASKKYNKEDAAILMINLTDGERETKETAVQFIKDHQYEAMNLLLDTGGEAASAYQISSIPTTLFIDKEGYIAGGYNGGIQKDILMESINKLIENK